MRINVYTEELFKPDDVGGDKPLVAEVVTAEYVSSRTGLPMKNYGLRIFLKSAPELHYVPPRDDDRSAVTFWCGDKEKNVFAFLEMVRECATHSTLDIWRKKTEAQQAAAEVAERDRMVPRREDPIAGLGRNLRQLKLQGLSDARFAEMTGFLNELRLKAEEHRVPQPPSPEPVAHGLRAALPSAGPLSHLPTTHYRKSSDPDAMLGHGDNACDQEEGA